MPGLTNVALLALVALAAQPANAAQPLLASSCQPNWMSFDFPIPPNELTSANIALYEGPPATVVICRMGGSGGPALTRAGVAMSGPASGQKTLDEGKCLTMKDAKIAGLAAKDPRDVLKDVTLELCTFIQTKG